MRWKQRLTNREQAKANRAALHVSAETTYRFTPAQHAAITITESIAHIGCTYLHNDDTLCRGILDGSILSDADDSGATSSVGTKADICHFIHTGHQSDKIFSITVPLNTPEKPDTLPHLCAARHQ
jgi:hypothetical protein